MELIYKNEHGAVYHIPNGPNPETELQLVVNAVGIFMSKSDLEHLLNIVKRPYEPCHCPDCGGGRDKIWCFNPIVDLCLKVNETILDGLEDLIKGTFFILDMDATLQKNKLIFVKHGNS
nr:hypothetical protein [Allomuricauda sp.]